MEQQKSPQRASLGIAFIPIIFLVVFLAGGIIIFGLDPHIPLVLSTIVAALVGIKLGFTWDDLEKHFIGTITLSMQACLILMIIGMLIGAWIMSGTVPAMIYYGLKVMSPGFFLTASCIMCSIVSLATGSSWTTAGTVGVAIIGIGEGLGVPSAITAGAVVSGAYFGDKMSPLSDTTNLAPAMAGTTLFEHIGHMVITTGPSLLIALVLYTIIGLGYAGQELDQANIDAILSALSGSFNINLALLIPPILVIGMVVFKVPAIPGLIAGTLIGALFILIFQQGHYGSFSDTIGAIMSNLHYGFESDSGMEMVDELLTRGGMDSMMWTVSLIICAMSFGGVMEKTGCLEAFANALLSVAKSTGSLVLVTILSSIFINLIAADQYLAIVIPGRMYKNEYRKRGLHPKNLSRTLEDAGTLTSCLIPWNTCGAFMNTALGVHPFAFLPYAFLNTINPVVATIIAYSGYKMTRLSDEEMKIVEAEIAAGEL